MRAGSRVRPTLAVATTLVALAALAVLHSAGGTGPPLYDGVCLPPHYLVLGATPGPASASSTYTADQLGQTQELVTGDSSPQAQMILASGSLAAPPGGTVVVTIRPVAAPKVAPPDGTVSGNVYEFSARASNGSPVDLAPGHPATVVLAAPSSGGPELTVERFNGSGWTALKTFQSGCGDTEEAAAPSLGLFALVATSGGGSSGGGSSGGSSGGGSSPSPAPSSGPPVALIVVLVMVVLLGLAVGATRLSRRRR